MGKFIFLEDFVILDFQVDFKVPIILRRPFLAIGQAMVNTEHKELTFHLNTEEMKFKVRASMKRPKDITMMKIVNIDVACTIDSPVEERLGVELLTTIVINFSKDDIGGYDDSVHSVQGKGPRHFTPLIYI